MVVTFFNHIPRRIVTYRAQSLKNQNDFHQARVSSVRSTDT